MEDQHVDRISFEEPELWERVPGNYSFPPGITNPSKAAKKIKMHNIYLPERDATEAVKTGPFQRESTMQTVLNDIEQPVRAFKPRL